MRDPLQDVHDPAGGCCLSCLEVGQEATVDRLAGGPGLRARLMELGILPGGTVRLIRRAPFGCPLEVDVEGSRFSIRRETASGVRLRHA